ncbi:cytochrome P450 4F12-like [Planococcus citri]|uniref:cytochrome P450 4F12-like n=1 Tax=Planococcus citri TaxID=170843 RepID=UPI0031F94232
MENLLQKVEKIMQPYDRLVYWLGPVPVLVLTKCDDIATILNQSVDRDDLRTAHECLGIGLLTARCEEWKKSRRILTPAFSSDMLLKYIQVFNENASNVVEEFKSAADRGEEIDVLDCITNLNLDAIISKSNIEQK